MQSMGRPTKFKEEYCDRLVDHMAEGFSFESFAGKVLVSRQTIYSWLEKSSNFLDSKRRGEMACLYFWENASIKGMFNTQDTKLNVGNWVFNMKNRFNWKDSHQIDLDNNEANQFTEENKAAALERLHELLSMKKEIKK